MPASGFRQRGISEVGHVTSVPADVPWGKTQEEGVTLQLSLSRVDLMSGQSNLMEESQVQSVSMELNIRLIEAQLELLKDALGAPDAKFAGDLEDVAPTAESLVLDGTLGQVERTLYVLGVGPASTRRIQATRCVLLDPGAVQLAKSAYHLPTLSWRVLNPAAGDAVTITDAT